jgi:hypothetical protein
MSLQQESKQYGLYLEKLSIISFKKLWHHLLSRIIPKIRKVSFLLVLHHSHNTKEEMKENLFILLKLELWTPKVQYKQVQEEAKKKPTRRTNNQISPLCRKYKLKPFLKISTQCILWWTITKFWKNGGKQLINIEEI